MKGQTESDVIKAIRILSARQVEAAGSGHPGTPLGAAPVMASANGALHFGVREYAMAAICNGIALHGDYAEEQSSMPEPEADLREVYDRLYVIYDSIYPAMKKIFADMRGV